MTVSLRSRAAMAATALYALAANAAGPAMVIQADIVRGVQPNMTAPGCVLNSQFKHKEEMVWRIRVIDAKTGQPLDDKGLKSVVLTLSSGQTVSAHFGGHPPPKPIDTFWTIAWWCPTTIDRQLQLHHHGDRHGRPDRRVRAVQVAPRIADDRRRREVISLPRAAAVALALIAALGTARAAPPDALGPRCRRPSPRGLSASWRWRRSTVPPARRSPSPVRDLARDKILSWCGARSKANGRPPTANITAASTASGLSHRRRHGRRRRCLHRAVCGTRRFWVLHDIVAQHGERLLTQTGFSLDMSLRISPESGPPGTPIAIDVAGIGWRELENSWMLVYDNGFTGWVSAVATRGAAHFTIPATGGPGTHVLQLIHGEFTFPYLNPQQNPVPDRPRFRATFRVTPGEPMCRRRRQAGAGERSRPRRAERSCPSRAFGGVGQPLVVTGQNFAPGKSYRLDWTTVTGNRVAQGDWDESAKPVSEAVADAAGTVAFRLTVPDDLGVRTRWW